MERSERLKQCLLNQGVWEKEVNEVLSNFSKDVTEKDLSIITIFDCLYDLGKNYQECMVWDLDYHILNVLNYKELGQELLDNCEEYLELSDGRIIEFEL